MYKLINLFMFLVFAGLVYQPGKAVSDTQKKYPDFPYKLQLHTGDIILRTGKGVVSEIFRKSSQKDKTYSHAGVICESRGKYFVVHILSSNGETGLHLRIEPISDFCDPETNKGFGIYRYQGLMGKEMDVKMYLKDLISKHVKFDDQFDLKTDNSMYCSELIYKMSRSVANLELPVSESSGRKYIAIDNLYLYPNATLVAAIQY